MFLIFLCAFRIYLLTTNFYIPSRLCILFNTVLFFYIYLAVDLPVLVSTQYNSFSFFYLVFSDGCGSTCFPWYFTAKWLLMFSLYLLILQFGASTLTMDVHEVSRNATWAASLLLTHWQEVDWTTRRKNKALKYGKASKSMPSTVRLNLLIKCSSLSFVLASFKDLQ